MTERVRLAMAEPTLVLRLRHMAKLSGNFDLPKLFNEAADEIERLTALAAQQDGVREAHKEALEEIERKYAAIMKDPPDWVAMTQEQLKWAREAWYGASLIARRALEQAGD